MNVWFRWTLTALILLFVSACIQKPTVPEPERDEPEPPDDSGPTAIHGEPLPGLSGPTGLSLSFLI
ncbi:MAG: hypothetical protein EA422_05445 [Gemmatimonadales bacterium]|nr:MAG: hypothetical protein EA422_05445 [Gemmatimonadales bacterium]